MYRYAHTHAMETFVTFASTIDTPKIFSAAAADTHFVLQSRHQLYSLADAGVRVAQFYVTTASRCLSELINELPDSCCHTQLLKLPNDDCNHMLPVAILVRSVENSYPFTLEWSFSGSDAAFVQRPKMEERQPFLGSLLGHRRQQQQQQHYYNTVSKFRNINDDRFNSCKLLGFDSAAFRDTTKLIMDESNGCYFIHKKYKYYTALRHAFMHRHADHPRLRLMLQDSDDAWKVPQKELDDVLVWIDRHCITNAEPLVVSKDSFKVSIRKYDGESWHVHNQIQADTTVPVAAKVAVALLYLPAELEVAAADT